MMKPLALLTNDDGVGSYFFEILVEEAARHFLVVVAAPLEQQSWIGRALSRRRPVKVTAVVVAGQTGWAIDGTPTDAVNIALNHLLRHRPTVVISGLNIGFNTGNPLLLSSGTVAAALEGAVFGIPAVAAS